MKFRLNLNQKLQRVRFKMNSDKYNNVIISLFVVLGLVCNILISYGYTAITLVIITIIFVIYIFISHIRDIKALDDIAAKKDKDGDDHE